MTAARHGARVDLTRVRLAALGLAMILGIVATVGIILLLFTGQFTKVVPVSTVLPSAGNAVQIGTPVVYRNVTVGQVSSEGSLLTNGTIEVGLHIRPQYIGQIPHGVTATVAPSTLFGTQTVILNAPPQVGTAHLAADQVIPPSAGESSSIQNTVSSLDYILNAVRPADLYQAFTAVAQALNGQGTGLGQTLSHTDTYLQQALPYFPTAEADLALLVPVANTITASTPNVLGTVSNLSSVSQNLTANQTNLHQFLVAANTTSNSAAQFLGVVQGPLENLIADLGPLLADLSQSPTEISSILQGLDQFAKSWSAAETQGPYLSFSSNVPIANATDLILGAVGGGPNAGSLTAQGLGNNLVNPATYSPGKDCPSYGSLHANCSGGSSGPATAALTSPNEPGLQLDSAMVPGPVAEQATSSFYAGFNHGQPPASPGATALLLSPLMTQLVGTK